MGHENVVYPTGYVNWKNGFGPENVGLIFPMIASHFSKRDNDQQNHWVQCGTRHFQTHPNRLFNFVKQKKYENKKSNTCLKGTRFDVVFQIDPFSDLRAWKQLFDPRRLWGSVEGS